MEENAVKIERLSFKYRGADGHALKGIELEIPRGQFVVILGPSGAGKSTLCYLLNGLIPGSIRGELEGEVTVFGHSTRKAKVSQLAELVDLVFQDFEAQLFSTNVELEVAFGPENFGLPREEIRRRIADSLKVVHLVGLENREPATLSGGQKQRLAIASVLSIHPKMICMDEPTTDLDPVGKEEVFAVAGDLKANKDMTLLIVEHETEEAVHADRVLIMEGGEIRADGTPREVLTRVDWLRGIGVQPLGVTELCARLGEDTLPLTVEEAATQLVDRGYRIDRVECEALRAEEAGRAATYGPPIIQVQGLTHSYPNGVKALDGVDLEIRQGEFVAVVGQNGSGKTTLVKHFNGLLKPTTGRVLIKGKETTRLPISQLGGMVGYVFQNPDHQIFAETVEDEVAFGPRNFGVPQEEIAARVRQALEAVGLAGYEKEDPFSLTKGERQRVAVASILAAKPDVIILDEPTTGLDFREQRSMMELVRSLNQAGHTIIAVTHTMWVVAEYAHRMIVVRDGRVAMDGPTREVMGRERELVEASLKPPQVVRLANRLGAPLLTVDECVRVLRRGGER